MNVKIVIGLLAIIGIIGIILAIGYISEKEVEPVKPEPACTPTEPVKHEPTYAPTESVKPEPTYTPTPIEGILYTYIYRGEILDKEKLENARMSVIPILRELGWEGGISISWTGNKSYVIISLPFELESESLSAINETLADYQFELIETGQESYTTRREEIKNDEKPAVTPPEEVPDEKAKAIEIAMGDPRVQGILEGVDDYLMDVAPVYDLQEIEDPEKGTGFASVRREGFWSVSIRISEEHDGEVCLKRYEVIVDMSEEEVTEIKEQPEECKPKH